MAEDKTWYVAIVQIERSYCTCFVGAGGESYRNNKEFAVKRGLAVVAEHFQVSEDDVDRLTGSKNKRCSENSPLIGLVRRLNVGEKFDVQKELDSLCAQAT